VGEMCECEGIRRVVQCINGGCLYKFTKVGVERSFINEKCYMYLNFYKCSLTKIMWSLFIGTRSISFY
jgi:hypothetical protein